MMLGNTFNHYSMTNQSSRMVLYVTFTRSVQSWVTDALGHHRGKWTYRRSEYLCGVKCGIPHQFLTGIASGGVTTRKCAAAHGPSWKTGFRTTKNGAAAPLRCRSYARPFLPPQEAHRAALVREIEAHQVQAQNPDPQRLVVPGQDRAGQAI